MQQGRGFIIVVLQHQTPAVALIIWTSSRKKAVWMENMILHPAPRADGKVVFR
jgi:hypothetical protein